MEVKVYEDNMTTDEIASLLVKLYGEYINACGGFGDSKSDDYAKAIGIAIRMLTD